MALMEQAQVLIEPGIIELGVASEATQGGEGPLPEFVRDMSVTGLAKD
jgi:hypothetical protein